MMNLACVPHAAVLVHLCVALFVSLCVVVGEVDRAASALDGPDSFARAAGFALSTP
jgi:hypothetical protein